MKRIVRGQFARSFSTVSILFIATAVFGLSGCGGGGGGDASGSGGPVPDTTAPETTITSSPAALTNLTIATFAFSSSESNSTFEASFDGGAFSGATSPAQLAILSDGQHTYLVRARDAAGNLDATPAKVTWTVDTLAPNTTLTSTPSTLSNSTSASFTYTSTKANSRFEASVDGGPYTAAPSLLQMSGLADGSHSFSVRAIDAATNVDPTPASFNWTVDATGPTARIVFPTKVSYTDAGSLAVRGSAQDASGVTSVSVNGVPATTTNSFGSWQATIPIVSGQNSIVVSATDTAGNTNSNADSASVTNNGTSFVHVRAMDLDAGNNRLLAVDYQLKAIVAVNLTTARSSVLSDRTHGSGTNFNVIENLAGDSANNRVLVLDWAQDLLFGVDLSNGNRTVISPASVLTATQLTLGYGLTLDAANNRAYVAVAGNQSIIAVDLATGARSVVSSSTVGTGTGFNNPADVVYDAVTNPSAPRLLVSDSGLHALVAVDLATGNRSTFSSVSPAGTGTALESPIRMKLDGANNRLLVIDGAASRNALVAVSLATGNRTTLADATTGNGFALSLPFSLAFDAANSRAYTAATTGGEIVNVDLSSLSRSLFSHSNVGTGIKMVGPRGVIVKNASGTPTALLFVDAYYQSVFNLDLATGNRTVVSGPSTGSGFIFNQPSDMVLDAITDPAVPRVLVLDSTALFAVNLLNGNRTVLSSTSVGGGPVLSFARNMILDATNNRVLVTDSTLDALLTVDLATGNRTIVANSAQGSGTNFILPMGVVLDNVSNPLVPRALVSDGQLFGLVAVNIANGNRDMFSSFNPTGTGIPFELPGESVLDTTSQRVLVADLSQDNLMSVNLANGNRLLISGRNAADESVLGTGPSFSFPYSIEADFTNNVSYVVGANRAAISAVDMISGDRVLISR